MENKTKTIILILFSFIYYYFYGTIFPQLLTPVFLLIYLLNRYNYKLLILLMVAASKTYKISSILFFFILIYEFVSVRINLTEVKQELKEYFNIKKTNLKKLFIVKK